MGKLVCVANWSEGRSVETIQAMHRAIEPFDVKEHYFEADVDHNRLVTAFSGEHSAVRAALLALAEPAFEKINMASHTGVHPRIGALDVCPFVVLENSMALNDALVFVTELAQEIADRYALPIFLYEKSETGKHQADLPSLRSGQYEGLFNRELNPDFGPRVPNPRLGASIFGVRNWLIAMNVNLKTQDETVAQSIAKKMRQSRSVDKRFTGVRALGFPLASRQRSQVSMNLTQPDLTPVDPIIEWISDEAKDFGTKVIGTELIGVIHKRHLKTATKLNLYGRQILE